MADTKDTPINTEEDIVRILRGASDEEARELLDLVKQSAGAAALLRDQRIKNAAPELLEALKRAVDVIRTWHGMNEPAEFSEATWRLYRSSPEMKAILTAIAKAEGVL